METIKLNNRLKHLSTFGVVCFFIGGFLTFLQMRKSIFISDQAGLWTGISLWMIGTGFVIAFIYLRYKSMHKSEYEYFKKEYMYLIGSFLLLALATILTLVLIIITVEVKSNQICFYIVYPLLFVCVIGASILETLSRIKEMIYFNQLDEQHKKDNKVQRVELIKQEMVQKKITEENEKQLIENNPFDDEQLNKELQDSE